MSPLAELLAAPWRPWPAAAVLFVHGWVLWFVLGQNFTRTVFMSAAARAVVGAGSLGLLASGALGRPDPAWTPDAVAWTVAGVLAWLICWSLEIATLGPLMRRIQPGWRWRAYDLAVLGAAQGTYLVAGALTAW